MMVKEENTDKNNITFSESQVLERLIKTFELIEVDKGLLLDFKQYAESGEYHQAWFTLKEYNASEEKEKEIKIARPVLHGYDEDAIFAKVVQEAYVTARLFNAGDRLLNSILSSDWEETNSGTDQNMGGE